MNLKHQQYLGSTLPETNSLHLKMDGWKTSFLLGRPIFRCELLVSGRVDKVDCAFSRCCLEDGRGDSFLGGNHPSNLHRVRALETGRQRKVQLSNEQKPGCFSGM